MAEHSGQRWAVIHAQIDGDAFDDKLPLLVDEQVRAARRWVQSQHGELLAAGSQVFDEFKNLVVWNKTNGGMGA